MFAMREHSHVWQDYRDVLRPITVRQPRGEDYANGDKGEGKGRKGRGRTPPRTPPRNPRHPATETPPPASHEPPNQWV
eukprot:3168186-Heterocapsa_arctica.AAC.1